MYHGRQKREGDCKTVAPESNVKRLMIADLRSLIAAGKSALVCTFCIGLPNGSANPPSSIIGGIDDC